MKKILIVLAFVALMFTACTPTVETEVISETVDSTSTEQVDTTVTLVEDTTVYVIDTAKVNAHR